MQRRQRRAPAGDPVILDVEKFSHEGRGIAQPGGKITFVDDALAGEEVRAVYTARRDSFDEAKTLEVLRSSPDRVKAPCEYASICGGCSLQHFEAKAQLRFKEGVLHEKLSHSIGRDDYERLASITGPVFGYRRKARLAVRHVAKKGKVLIGFREKHSALITDMSSCKVLDPRVDAVLPELAHLIASLKGFRLIPQIEVAAGDPSSAGQDWALVFRHLAPLSPADLRALEDFARTRRCDLYLQSGGPATVKRLYPSTGPERLHYQLNDFGLTLSFHPMDFTQVNAEINRRMIARAVDLLDPDQGDKVLDLFCGLGNFTLPLATRAASVTGVEGSADMVARGYENAAANGITNTEFHAADLSLPIVDRHWFAGGFDKVLLDPPRSGALEILANIASVKPSRIVYISCNPATLARDAAQLESLGYRLRAAGVMDMFPHTTHVESMAVFEQS